MARFASTDRFAIYSIISMNMLVLVRSTHLSSPSVLGFHFKKFVWFIVFNFFFRFLFVVELFHYGMCVYVCAHFTNVTCSFLFLKHNVIVSSNRMYKKASHFYVSQMILVLWEALSFRPKLCNMTLAIPIYFSCFKFISTFFHFVFYHFISPAILPPTLTYCRRLSALRYHSIWFLCRVGRMIYEIEEKWNPIVLELNSTFIWYFCALFPLAASLQWTF